MTSWDYRVLYRALRDAVNETHVTIQDYLLIRECLRIVADRMMQAELREEREVNEFVSMRKGEKKS